MTSTSHRRRFNKNELNEIGPGFWNVRGHFKLFSKRIDIGTQMSLIQLRNGNFLVIDTVELNEHLKIQIDQLTDHGNLIEGVIAVHPSHILSFASFYQTYPQAAYYGTPRHLHRLKQIPWLGSLDDCNVRQKWECDVEMRIIAGGEFVNPSPADHLVSVFVFHRPSRTLHVDDTIMYTDKFGPLFRLFGYRHGLTAFHPSIKKLGLHPTADAPYLFRDCLRHMLRDWPLENLCCAHLDVKLGGAHELITELVDRTEPLFRKLSERNKKKNPEGRLPVGNHLNTDVTGDECG